MSFNYKEAMILGRFTNCNGCSSRKTNVPCECEFCAELDASGNIINRNIYGFLTNNTLLPAPRTSGDITQIGHMAPCTLKLTIDGVSTDYRDTICTDATRLNGDWYLARRPVLMNYNSTIDYDVNPFTSQFVTKSCKWETHICTSGDLFGYCGITKLQAWIGPDWGDGYVFSSGNKTRNLYLWASLYNDYQPHLDGRDGSLTEFYHGCSDFFATPTGYYVDTSGLDETSTVRINYFIKRKNIGTITYNSYEFGTNISDFNTNLNCLNINNVVLDETYFSNNMLDAHKLIIGYSGVTMKISAINDNSGFSNYNMLCSGLSRTFLNTSTDIFNYNTQVSGIFGFHPLFYNISISGISNPSGCGNINRLNNQNMILSGGLGPGLVGGGPFINPCNFNYYRNQGYLFGGGGQSLSEFVYNYDYHQSGQIFDRLYYGCECDKNYFNSAQLEKIGISGVLLTLATTTNNIIQFSGVINRNTYGYESSFQLFPLLDTTHSTLTNSYISFSGAIINTSPYIYGSGNVKNNCNCIGTYPNCRFCYGLQATNNLLATLSLASGVDNCGLNGSSFVLNRIFSLADDACCWLYQNPASSGARVTAVAVSLYRNANSGLSMHGAFGYRHGTSSLTGGTFQTHDINLSDFFPNPPEYGIWTQLRTNCSTNLNQTLETSNLGEAGCLGIVVGGCGAFVPCISCSGWYNIIVETM